VFLLLVCVSHVYGVYNLANSYAGSTFFDGFAFEAIGDPTHGYVNYVSKADATARGLINTTNDIVYIGTDMKNVASGRGRDSVRLSSNTVYNGGLFVIDLSHMPTGCGTWPAFWTVGPNWPNEGEIDIIEGVNLETADQVTLHTNDGCNIANEDKSKFTGTVGNTNCQGNSGCGIKTGAGSYGAPFNSHQGGVYAMEWTTNYIQTFYWPRGSVPANVDSKNPDPSTWGKPFAYFQFGSACPNSHFKDHKIIFDLTYCGDWAGAVFSSQCPGKGNCNDYVKNNPAAFREAYWHIHYVRVFLNK